MKRILTALSLLLLAFALTSCTTIGGKPMELTDNQRAVLQSALIDLDKAEKGLDAQQLLLAQKIEKAEAYLKDRYPGREIVFTGLVDVFYKDDVIAIKGVSDGAAFQVTLVSEKDDLSDLRFTDSLYTVIKREELDELVARMFAEEGYAGAKVDMELIGAYDDRYDPAQSLAKAAETLPVSMTGAIYLPSSAEGLTAERVKDMMTRRGYSGTLTVWIMDAVPDGEPQSDWAKTYCIPGGAQKLFVTLK